MKTKLLIAIISSVFIFQAMGQTTLPKEHELLVCQDEADNFGSGKGKDNISAKCLSDIKIMAKEKGITQKSSDKVTSFFGYRNMIIIEKETSSKILTDIIAGTSTELKSIRKISIDEKNNEIAVLEDDGDILFFSAKITGNIAPYRILRHRELVGATEIAINSSADQIVAFNKQTHRILIFSRQGNIYAPAQKRKLNILHSFNTSGMELKNLSLDELKGEIYATDTLTQKAMVFKIPPIK